MEGRTNLVGNLLDLAAKEASPAQLGSASFGLASLDSASLGSAILIPASLGSARCNLASFAKYLVPNTALAKKLFVN